ncbi:hypothetical protein C8Q75DRAFT_103717 [Abortiporus biennis]|nr:hypothetical protein C8Q75DRAFT_103717 [Abortiporus biennis]
MTSLPHTPLCEPSHIMLLPGDVLFLVFVQVVAGVGLGYEIPTVFRLTHVCRFWRNTAHRSALLWKTIRLGRATKNSDCLDFILSLAGQTPLKVIAHMAPEKRDESEIQFLQRCLQEFPHIDMLVWTRLQAKYFSTVSHILQNVITNSPSNILRQLVVSNYQYTDDPMPVFPMMDLPYLEILHVTGYSILSMIPLIQPGIKELRLHDTRRAMGTSILITALMKMPRLERLRLSSSVEVCSTEKTSVNLPCLQTLVIDEHPEVLLKLLDLIIFPIRTTTLHIGCGDIPISDISLALQAKVSSMVANIHDPHTALIQLSGNLPLPHSNLSKLTLQLWSREHAPSSCFSANGDSQDMFSPYCPKDPTFQVEYATLDYEDLSSFYAVFPLANLTVIHLGASFIQPGGMNAIIRLCKLPKSLKTLVIHNFDELHVAFAMRQLFTPSTDSTDPLPPLGSELVLHHVKSLASNRVATPQDELVNPDSLTSALFAATTHWKSPVLSRMVFHFCEGFLVERMERLKEFVQDGNIEWDNLSVTPLPPPPSLNDFLRLYQDSFNSQA